MYSTGKTGSKSNIFFKSSIKIFGTGFFYGGDVCSALKREGLALLF